MIELDRRVGAFGTVRVFQRTSDSARLYCIGASIQTMAAEDGVSLFGYVHAAKLLLSAARDVLIIGGAGGSLATMLARRGKSVTVVDVDPVAEQFAREYFHLDSTVEWITADALDFIGASQRRFDAVFIDACDERGLISPFTDYTTLRRVWKIVRKDGSMLLNLVGDDRQVGWEKVLGAKLATLGARATLFRPDDGWEGNELMLVSNSDHATRFDANDVSERPAEVRTYLMSLKAADVTS